MLPSLDLMNSASNFATSHSAEILAASGHRLAETKQRQGQDGR
jgi:hypothetical protein